MVISLTIRFRGERNNLDELAEKCRRVICDEAFNELFLLSENQYV